jgi:hypothetical protein
MERRKFLIGTGALASGSAAAVGTGAFTSVSADRDVNVNVAGDASAYLAITADDTNNGAHYVDETNNGVQIDLNGDDNTGGGDAFGNGLNDDADVKFADLLQVTNQGTETIWVGVSEPAPISDGDGNNVGSVFIGELQNTAGGSTKEGGGGFSVPDDPVPLGVGRTVDKIGLSISDTSALQNSETLTITFEAYTEDEWTSEFGSAPPNPVDPSP